MWHGWAGWDKVTRGAGRDGAKVREKWSREGQGRGRHGKEMSQGVKGLGRERLS